MITINSDSIISKIDSHFKVSAGPGAGKTYWLVNHIKNVLHSSNRLYRTKKIACITYTNIAVETILGRLGTSSNQVEVSTIHSFLYKNIVKPYASFIANEFGLNVKELDGHDEIYLTFGKIKEWADETNQSYLYYDKNAELSKLKQKNLKKALNNLQWILENNDVTLKINPKKSYLSKITPTVSIRSNSLINFKKKYWEKGILAHDDVLFFSFQIIKKFPFVIEVLTAKFPYIFIDEFQDSNPIQVELFRLIGISGTTIGIIGDVAQSIYVFQGADFRQFNNFKLSNVTEYQLIENRRSSNEIIRALNNIRKDILS